MQPPKPVVAPEAVDEVPVGAAASAPVGEARHDGFEGQQGVTWQGARGSARLRGKKKQNKIDNISRAINNIIIFFIIFF